MKNSAPSVTILDLVPHYNEHDRRIYVKSDPDGQLRGLLQEKKPIICQDMEGEGISAWPAPGVTRIAHIYHRLSQRIQVQSFYGIYEEANRKYAIMEDLSDASTLNSAVRNPTEPVSVSVRLHLVLDLANTMAYLHRVGILLKSMSDSTVFLKLVNGEYRPIITELEAARLVNDLSIHTYTYRYSFLKPPHLWHTMSATRRLSTLLERLTYTPLQQMSGGTSLTYISLSAIALE